MIPDLFVAIDLMYYDGDTDTFTNIGPHIELGEN